MSLLQRTEPPLADGAEGDDVRLIVMRNLLVGLLLFLSVTGCKPTSAPSTEIVSPGTDAVEVCGPPCSVLEEPKQVSALVQALNDGGEGFETCLPDQVIYKVRFREGGTWGEPITVPAFCGSTQGTTKPHKVTDKARELLSDIAAAAR